MHAHAHTHARTYTCTHAQLYIKVNVIAVITSFEKLTAGLGITSTHVAASKYNGSKLDTLTTFFTYSIRELEFMLLLVTRSICGITLQKLYIYNLRYVAYMYLYPKKVRQNGMLLL